MSVIEETIETTGTDESVGGEELQHLSAKLEKLVTHHHAALKEENVLAPVEQLLRWIEDCEAGSSRAERKLYHEGIALLKEVHDRLQLALEEELRLSDESPLAAATARGRTADRYAEATAKTVDACDAMEHLGEAKH